MDIRKRKIKGYFALLALAIILSICLAMFIPNVTAVAPSEVAYAAVTPGTASVLNFNQNGVYTDNFSNVITGEQNEYIYLGSHVADFGNTRHTGAIRWRMLSANDTKYSGGSMLLWSDYKLGFSKYNLYGGNPDYAYWGTSMIRAELNGGDYLGAVSDATATPTLSETVDPNDSYLYKMFGASERLSIVKTNSYDTNLYGNNTSVTPRYTTTGIIATADGQTAKYNSNRVNNNDGAKYASVVNNTSVVETVSGDSLFLLDYYDVNNTVYGFGDNGTTYAKKLNSSWTPSSVGYPGYDDNRSIIVNYLKPTSGDTDDIFWLRTAGRNSASESYALRINNLSNIFSEIVTAGDYGVRPALNFSPSSVIYATAASVSSNNSAFASVNAISAINGKPAYKVYIKTADYKNYNEATSDRPSISVTDKNVSVIKTGQNGSVVILLADKSGSGNVMYQATASFDSNGIATATLPSGVKASDYSVTALFVDGVARGGNYTESITGSYTVLGPLSISKSISADYNGEVQTLETLKSNLDWYNSVYADSSIVEVEYLTQDESSMGLNYPKDKGNYKIKLTIRKNEEYSWGDSVGISDVTRTIDFEIKPKALSVDFKVDNTASPPTATAKPTNLCSSDSNLLNTILRIRYTGMTGLTPYDSYELPCQVGSYTAKVEIDTSVVGSSNYELDSTYSDTIRINPQVVAMPEIEPEEGSTLWYTYNGEDQYYIVSGFNSNQMEITIADDYVGLFDWDADGESIIVKNAGEYKDALKVSLKNAYNSVTGEGLNVWNATSKDTQPKYLSFTVNKAEIKVDVYAADNKASAVLNGIIGNSSLDVMIELSSKPSENINLTLTAKATTGSSEPTAVSSFNINSLTSTTSLDISSFKTVRTYVIDVTTDSKNYTVTMSRDITLSMKRVNNPNLIWLLRDTNGIPYEVEVDPSTKDVEFDGAKFIYNGKAYGIEVSEPSGYSVQGSIETVLEGTTAVLSEIKNAGTYVTTVKLVKDGETSSTAYTIKWTVDKAKFDLSTVKWKDDGKLEYTGSPLSPSLENMPSGLTETIMGADSTATSVGTHGEVYVVFDYADDSVRNNYILPKEDEIDSYDGDFTWRLSPWEIIAVKIKLNWVQKEIENENGKFQVLVLSDSRVSSIVDYEYFLSDIDGNILDDTPLSADDIELLSTQKKYYVGYPVLSLTEKGNYVFVKKDGSDVTSNDDLYSEVFGVGGGSTAITVSLATTSYVYTGKGVVLRFPSGTPTGSLTLTYYEGDAGVNKLDGAPTAVGKYWVEVTSNNSSVVLTGDTKFAFEITKSVISTEWNTSAKPPVLRNLTSLQLQQGITYEYYDSEMHKVEYSALNAGGTFYIRAVLKDNANFEFDNGEVETETIEFTVTPGEELRDPSDINNPNYDFEGEDPNLPEDPNDPNEPTEPGDDKKPIDLGQFGEFMSAYWQPIVTAICIILILIFTGKGIGYASKKKENKRTIESKYSTYYAVAGTGLFGLTYTNWTIVACIMIGVMVLSFVFMLLEKRGYKKSQRDLEDAKEEFIRNQEDAKERRRDEEMKMMFMHMMGGNANGGMNGNGQQGGFAYAGQGLGAEEIRGIVSETMTAMLPNFQQYLPQQASSNDELVEKLIEQNEKLMKKLEEKPVERIVEKEVAATNVNDETLEKLANMMQSNSNVNEKTLEKIVKKLQPIANDETLLKVVSQSGANDETIKQMLKTQEEMMRNQEQLMEKILELSANQPAEPQVIEKIVEKEVPVEVEKVVEKEVPVEVEKIVEKEVVKEVKVEVPVEVEKIVEVPIEVEKLVEKIVEIPAEKPAPKAKVTAPRLTLDEAYEKLSAKQKKIFDTLKAYAMSKDKCKEKKSTYYILLGQSSVNPLVKLTIKKDTTVALFKMEDEFMKDIRRNATNDGTKVKVKETELIVGDMQALATAKEMVDLREDQIERYNEYLREQRSMKK